MAQTTAATSSARQATLKKTEETTMLYPSTKKTLISLAVASACAALAMPGVSRAQETGEPGA